MEEEEGLLLEDRPSGSRLEHVQGRLHGAGLHATSSSSSANLSSFSCRFCWTGKLDYGRQSSWKARKTLAGFLDLSPHLLFGIPPLLLDRQAGDVRQPACSSE